MRGVKTFGGELKPPLDEDLLEHHGVKGMHWGARKEEVRADIQGRTRKFGRRVPLEYETATTLVGLGALGLAFANSSRAQNLMKIPVSAATHYMSNKDNRRKVFRFLKKAGILYNKL